MVDINTIRESNAQGKQLDGIIAVFVGGTRGIGEITAKEFFKCTTNPRAYIIGRDEERGLAVVEKLHEINPQGTAIFMQKDISLLCNVDEITNEIALCERKIHILFLTAGFMTLKGRTETIEGIDNKMSVNYYSRIRFAMGLMPLLTAASQAHELSRVITVLAAGSEGEVRVDDLDLKHDFTLHKCLAHCVVMSDFLIQELAKRYPGTSFSHSYPGAVKTGIANELGPSVLLAVKVMYAVLTPWIINVEESGERHLFQMTSQCFPAAEGGAVGIKCPDEWGAFPGMDGRTGSGAYLLGADSLPTGDEAVLGKYRDVDLSRKVWEHTMWIFGQAEQINRNAQRLANGEAEGAGRSFPDPVGWRAA